MGEAQTPASSKQPLWGPAALFVVAVGVLMFLAERQVENALHLEFAGSEAVFTSHLAGRDLGVASFAWDWVLIAVYVVGGILLSRRIWQHPKFFATQRRITEICLVVAGVCDIVENVVIIRASADSSDAQARIIAVLAACKWALLFVTAVRAALHLPYARFAPPEDTTAHAALAADTRLAAPSPSTAKVGIACSGGGIRSAAFSLGALHALGPDRVRSADYLTAVSGGAYLATAMTQHDRARPDTSDRSLPFANPDSPELVRLRARSKYLFSNGAEARVAVTRAVLGTAVNLAFLWLLLFALLRPIGWFVSSPAAHPELRANAPLIVDASVDEIDESALSVASLVTRTDPATCDDGRTFEVGLPSKVTPELSVTLMPDVEQPSVVRDAKVPLSVKSATIVECDGELRVATPIRFSPVGTDDPQDDQLVAAFPEPAELWLTLDSDTVLPADSTEAVEGVAAVIEIDEQPTFAPESGVRGREPLTFDGWPWAMFGVCALIAAATIVFGVGTTRNDSRGTLGLSRVGVIVLAVGTAFVVVFVAIPWVLEAVPDLLDGSPLSSDSTVRSTAAVGLWAVVFAALRSIAKKAFDPKLVAGTMKRFGSAVMKAAAFVVSVLLAAAAAYGIVQSAAMNGPAGRFGGIGSSWWEPGWLFRLPDWWRWLFVVVLLALTAHRVPARIWSLHQLYRDRIARAFFPPRPDGSSPPPFVDPHPDPRPWPELLVCAAANFNDAASRDTIAAGRWAHSFVAGDRTTIGWPSAAVASPEYVQALAPRLRKDLLPESLAAVTGAAFSPAMGKFGYGPIGGLFAILNLRLGLWLPNPMWVARNAEPETWTKVAGWPTLVREVFGFYRRKAPFVYVTDGGHWENLGLVELMRRGCSEIYVLSAAGDGGRSFATISEAIGLAREQLGVEVEIELAGMRPAVSSAEASEDGRQLLDLKADPPVARPYAAEPYAVGTYRRAGSATPLGSILVIEANLTVDMPWDVHSYAEGHPKFPDDSTADQFFDFGQFEAYRKLGEYQMTAALTSGTWPPTP